MRAESCADCEHMCDFYCKLKGKPIAMITGCSQSDSGRVFFHSKSGAEKLRRDVIAPRIRMTQDQLRKMAKEKET